jgi:hypothetical protein
LKILESLAKLCAVLAGVLLTVITLMTCVSLIGRNTTGWTIVGDFELSGAAAGAAIALFLPWCQFRRGNIIVDFFTTRASPRTNATLDRMGALLLGWRCPAGLAHHHRRPQGLAVPVGHHDARLPRVDRLLRHGAAAGAVRGDRPGPGGARLRREGQRA